MLMSSLKPLGELEDAAEFVARHIGPDADDERHMLSTIGAASRRALIDAIVPRAIARSQPMAIPAPLTEAQALAELKGIAAKNRVLKSFIGQGYHGTHTPGVILRNILENPAWYTAYTPYQAEISQGRMEALVNFQTMVCDLTGMAIANASMLDEATAAAEAMTLAKRSVRNKSHTFVVAGDCHPQTIEVIQTRAVPLGLQVVLANSETEWDTLIAGGDYFAALIQLPTTDGSVHDLRQEAARIHAHQAAFIVAADLLALTLITPPGELGADIALGSTQRFGVPMGGGGPHAAYLACRDEFKRSLPGRLVGVSVDAHGASAYRLALQTREQHIRREKATSNICTAQVLLAVMASMYAVYHGPAGLKRIALRVASYTAVLAQGLREMGVAVRSETAFDAIVIDTGAETAAVAARAVAAGMNLRRFPEWGDTMIGINLGLPRHAHAGRHPAQHSGEPGLVHRLHALPGRDLAGPHGSAGEFPDHGLRPHRHGDRQRQHAGRSHRRGRGHDARQAQRQEQEPHLRGGRRLPPADHRGHPDPRGTAGPAGGAGQFRNRMGHPDRRR